MAQMTDSQKEVLIHIKTNVGTAIEEIFRLDKELNSLNDTIRTTQSDLHKVDQAFQEGKMSEADYEKETARLKTELESLNAQVKYVNTEQKSYRKEIENAVKAYEANDGSIKQMRLELSNMRKEYEALSKAERDSSKGTDMLTKIQTTTDELKRLEEAQGDFRRSVGNYQKALEGVSPTLTAVWRTINGFSGGTMDMNKAVNGAIPVLKNFGKQLLALMKNPIVLAIAAIVMVLKELVDAFKRNDAAMTALQQLFASFQPIIDVFLGLLDGIVKGLTKVIGWATKGVTAIMSLIPAFKESSEAAQDYVKAMDDLEEKERTYAVETAKNEAKISELRRKATEKDKYSAEQRKQFLEEAGELEKANLKMNLETAKEKVRLAKEDAKRRHDTSDETMNQIAQLEAAYWQAIKGYEDGMRAIVKSTQKARAEIDKEMNKDITLPEFKKQKAKLEKAVKDAKDVFEKTDYNTTNIFGQVIFNKKLYEENKANLENAQADLNNYVEANESTAESNSNRLQQIARDRAKNLLDAQRAYEDAILDSMDDTLDKQLKMVEKEYKREIEDLKLKLQTEENLTKEAREYINKLIVEKERKLQETLILTQAQYWATVREDARNAMNEIMKMNAKMMSADPGRVGGAFAENAMEQIRNAAKEFDDQSTKLTKAFSVQFNAMNGVITKALDDNQKALDEMMSKEGETADQMLDKSKLISANVVEVMKAMRDGTDEFFGGADKNLYTFMQALEGMRNRIGMTDDEYKEMFEILKPFLTNINEYYTTLMGYPQKFATYMSNLVQNQVKADAERIRKVIIDNMDFRGLAEFDAKAIEDEIAKIDKILKGKTKDWQKILQLQPWQTGSVSLEELGLDRLETDAKKIMEKVNERLKFKFNWDVDFKLDDETSLRLLDIAEKYGEQFDASFSGVLQHLTGSDDINQQMEWLVKNYESAIGRIEQINKDFQEAYTITGDDTFKNAMIDEAVITSQLRRIYDLAKRYGKDYEDWEADRLEIQGRYVGEGERELKVRLDLLALEERRMTSEREGYQNQLDYIYEIWDTVKEYEEYYNDVNTANMAQISVLEEQLQVLKNEAATFDDTTSADVVTANAQATEQIEAKIQQLTELTKTALQLLAETGFMSTEEMENAAKELEKKVMTLNNNIVDNTAQQAATTTSIWLNSFSKVAGGLGQVGNAFTSMFSEMGEMSDKWNAFAEASAYFTIGINMAEGIAEAVASGAGMPFPYNLAAILAGIAAVVSGIGAAFSTYNQYHKPTSNFADGGLIGGRTARTKSEGRRDDIDIKASKGEYVINAETVKKYGVRFFDEINYGRTVTITPKLKFADGGYVTANTMQSANEAANIDNMRAMMSEVMSEIQPVVSVKEINTVQNRVKVKENIARNK